MAFCNYDETNLDWILETLKTILDRTENGFQEVLDEYMRKYFNSLFADITYLPETETIVLQLSSRDPISQQAAEEATQTANEAKTAVANATKVSYDSGSQSLVFRQGE